MGGSFTQPANDAHANNALPQPALALVAEDDDEPPSSGPRRDRSPQITSSSPSAPDPPSKIVEVKVLEKDYANNDIVLHEKASASHIDNPTSTETPDVTAHGDISQADLEKLEIVGHKRVRRRGFKTLKLSRGARVRALFTPQHPIGPSPTYAQSALNILRYSPLNILLLFIPVSWALHFTHQSPTLVFIFSGLGIVPLAALLGFGTEQIALRTSQSVGGLLNASLGNLIEMIIAGIALKQCELEVVQSALLGGLLSNLLLVLGCAFIGMCIVFFECISHVSASSWWFPLPPTGIPTYGCTIELVAINCFSHLVDDSRRLPPIP
jgi:Ca2+:H+ antiporter